MKNRNSQSSSSRSPRFALAAGALALAASLLPLGGANTAHAIDKADAYKAGAAVLGAAGVYYGVKGKSVPAVIAGAGAYYAYKKGRDTDRNNNNNNRYPNRRDNRNDRRSDRGNTYPDDYSRYPADNGGYRYPDTNRYPDNRNGDVYAGGYDQYPDYGYNGLNKSNAKRGPIRVK